MHIVCLGPLTLMAVNHICTYHMSCPMLLSFKNFALQAMWDISVGVKAKQTQMEEKQGKEKWIFQKKRKKDTKKIQLKLSLQKQLSIRFAGSVSNAASGESISSRQKSALTACDQSIKTNIKK